MLSLSSNELNIILSKLKLNNIARVSSVSKKMKNKTMPILSAVKTQRILKMKQKQRILKKQMKLSFELIRNGKQYINEMRRRRNFPQIYNMKNILNNIVLENNTNKLLTNRQQKIIKFILINYLILSEADYNEFPIPNIHSNMRLLYDMSENVCNQQYNIMFEHYFNNIQNH